MLPSPPTPPRTIGICGIGQMGTAAAVAFQRGGHRVLLWGRNPQKLEAVGAELEALTEWTRTHLGPSPYEGPPVARVEDLAVLDNESDVVLDCILEVLEQKAALFHQLTSSRARNALFLSATSGLSISQLGKLGECEALLVGAHFWNPPHLIPVVEMIAGTETPIERLQSASELMAQIGKIPVQCRDVPGFIGNRLLHAMWREALALVNDGVCSAADLDRVIKLTFALRLPALGPMENMDLVGLDAVARIHTYLLPELAHDTTPAAVLQEKIAAGHLGMKSGKGFYDWTEVQAAERLKKRDTQVVRQLALLKELGDL